MLASHSDIIFYMVHVLLQTFIELVFELQSRSERLPQQVQMPLHAADKADSSQDSMIRLFCALMHGHLLMPGECCADLHLADLALTCRPVPDVTTLDPNLHFKCSLNPKPLNPKPPPTPEPERDGYSHAQLTRHLLVAGRNDSPSMEMAEYMDLRTNSPLDQVGLGLGHDLGSSLN